MSDEEINEALADRVAVKINDAMHVGETNFESMVCPECGQLPSFMREVLLQCIRRSTFEGERRLPRWYQPSADLKYDYVCTGALGDGLIASAPVLYFHGSVPCTECGELLSIDIEIETRLDGRPLESFQE